ncbi:MAG: serine/threonine protein kinase, partial [Myxococcales bacterium]
VAASGPEAATLLGVPALGVPAAGSGPVSAPVTPGEEQPLVAGKYRLVRLLGQGGMGAVYEARHEELGKRMAVKLVDTKVGHPQEVVDRFRREARATGAIDSEHIVQVFDAGDDPARGLYMAMEYLRGCDLATALTRVGRLEVDAACALVGQVAVGLQAAHEAGIVHRDLKPANIFLVPRSDGSLLVKLVDFGIAKVLDAAHPSHAMSLGTTRQGAVVGTPQYMSPEQAQGLRDVDARSDMYSLGAVFHEILTGASMVPLLATYEMTILHIMTKPVPPLRSLCPAAPAALAELIGRMVALEPEQRPADMEQVIAALLELRPALASLPLRIDGLVFDSVSRMPRSFSHPALGPRAGARSPSLAAADEVTPTDEPLVLPMRPASRGVLVAGLSALVALVALGWWSLRSTPEAPATRTPR